MGIKQEAEDGAGEFNNVVVFGPTSRKRFEPPPSDDELAEYRRLRPQILAMLADWPQLLREHRAVASRCKLAKMIIDTDK